MRDLRSTLSDDWNGLAVVLATALMAAMPVVSSAQQTTHAPIEMKPLEPLALAPDAKAASDSAETGVVPRPTRFLPAPFRTLGSTKAPEPIKPVETVLLAGATLRELDKLTGRTKSFEIAAGGEALIDRLRVRLDACRAPENNLHHSAMAFLEIWDTKRDAPDPVFSGWMFAESPALLAMDHPRYDLWVINCTTSAAQAPKASE